MKRIVIITIERYLERNKKSHFLGKEFGSEVFSISVEEVGEISWKNQINSQNVEKIQKIYYYFC